MATPSPQFPTDKAGGSVDNVGILADRNSSTPEDAGGVAADGRFLLVSGCQHQHSGAQEKVLA